MLLYPDRTSIFVKLCNQRRNQRKEIGVLDRPFVDVAVTLAGSKRAVFLSYKEKSTGLWEFQWLDEVFGNMLI